MLDLDSYLADAWERHCAAADEGNVGAPCNGEFCYGCDECDPEPEGEPWVVTEARDMDDADDARAVAEFDAE